MAEQAISVRLDDETQGALKRLMERGLSRSEAIRWAIVEAAGIAHREQIKADVERVAMDEQDGAEMARVSEQMDSLAPPW